MTPNEAIAEMAKLAGLNQSTLADKLGIRPQNVHAWYQPRRGTWAATLERVADATGCVVKYTNGKGWSVEKK